MSNISEHIQKLDLGKEICLVQLDLTAWNEGTLYWVMGDENAAASTVMFDGQTYSPFPFRAEGFEATVSGTLPRPTLTISDISGIFTPLVLQYDNLRGAIFRRIRTFDRFLDAGPDPDPDAILPIDEFILARKTKHRPRDVISWEMASSIDLDGMQLPGRQIVRDFCDQEYRIYDPLLGGFDYSTATCPYAGTLYFGLQDQSVPLAQDQCAKFLTSCKKRFGATAPLPFTGFPGVARIRVK